MADWYPDICAFCATCTCDSDGMKRDRMVQMTELSMPLHTLIELEPRPDGTMVERRYKINIDSTCDDDVRLAPL